MGWQGGHYYHYYGYEYFERDTKKAYKISIHKSYRENGKMRKRQFALCTVDYYDFADRLFCLYDYAHAKIRAVADELNGDMDTIYDMVESKIVSLEEKIQAEFMQTEEYKAHAEHERILRVHMESKTNFREEYEVSGDEYDKCYDVFGTLRNPSYLEKIKREYKAKKEYEQNSRSYYEKFYDNYTNGNFSGYSDLLSGNYNTEDKDVLKQFYRVLSKKYHPDANPDTDTSRQMQLINELKSTWGI